MMKDEELRKLRDLVQRAWEIINNHYPFGQEIYDKPAEDWFTDAKELGFDY